MAKQPKTEAPPADEYKLTLVYYLGEREMSEGTCHTFMPVALHKAGDDAEQHDKLASPFSLRRKDNPPRIIGGEYTIPCKLKDDGHIQGIKIRFEPTGNRMPEALRAQHITRDRAADVANRARKQIKALETDPALTNVLGKLRMRYGETDSIGKMALEVVILHALRR